MEEECGGDSEDDEFGWGGGGAVARDRWDGTEDGVEVTEGYDEEGESYETEGGLVEEVAG